MTCDRCAERSSRRNLCRGCVADLAHVTAEAVSQQATDRALPRPRFVRPIFPTVAVDECWGAA